MFALRTRWRPSLFQKLPVNRHHKIPNRLAHKSTTAPEHSTLRTAQAKLRYAWCSTGHAVEGFLDFWRLVRRIGVPNRYIVSFRRSLRRFHYPWLSYSVPTALSLMAGDVISQLYIDQKKKESKLNWCRTIHYGLIGFFLLGPVTSKMFLIWYRRASRSGRLTRLTRTLLYDIFFVTPVTVASIIAAYDYKILWETLNQGLNKTKTKNTLDSLKSTMDKIVERYKSPFKDDMLLYLQTKPLIVLMACFILPSVFRNCLRRLYYIAFCSYISNRNFKYKLGSEIQKYRPGEKQKGGGGPACMLRDLVKAKLKGDKK